MHAVSSEPSAPLDHAKTVVIVDDDRMFLSTIRMNLEDEGFRVKAFDNGEDALDYFSGEGTASAVLLDWQMPRKDGLEVLRQLRADGFSAPVIFLTSLSDQIYEEAALDCGAVDFVEKSRSFGIILRRMRLIMDGTKGPLSKLSQGAKGTTDAVTDLGPLELRHDSRRAMWRGDRVNLTISEFKVVELLAAKRGTDVSYREIYDVVRGEGFVAGYGEEGFRANVRAIVKRIRQKFKDLDDGFANIANYPGFGYRWIDA